MENGLVEEQGMILLAGILQEKFTFLKYRTIPFYEDGLELRVVDVGKLQVELLRAVNHFHPFWQYDWLFPGRKHKQSGEKLAYSLVWIIDKVDIWYINKQ